VDNCSFFLIFIRVATQPKAFTPLHYSSYYLLTFENAEGLWDEPVKFSLFFGTDPLEEPDSSNGRLKIRGRKVLNPYGN